ncbi:hypothetical protein GCM10007973_09890 [Polymorphobacter multimanifer]|nr:hypothetical protein GCM10007973_09890 [Polymorphobacter multimanifer]
MFQPQLQGAGAQTAGAIRPLSAGMLQPATVRWPGVPVARARLGRWREAAAGLALGTDLSTDLGAGIGTRHWWLGLTSCLLLCGTAITLALDVPLIPAAGRAPLTPSQREALSGQFIAPLAFGGRTGATTRPDPALVVPLAEIPERPRIELTARTVRGRSLGATLKRAGVGASDIDAVEGLLRGVVNASAIPSATDIDLVLGRRETRSMPRPLELMGLRAAFDLRVAVSRVDGALVLKRIPIKIDSTPLRVNGLVAGGLDRALRSAGVPASAAAECRRVMGYVVDMQRGVGKKDRFDIIVERDRAETGEVRYGGMVYAALDRAGKEKLEVARHKFGGRQEWFRQTGESARKGLMRTPVDGARLTSAFGMRFHPLLAYSRMHQGVDFGARHGAPIFAAAAGKVAFVGPHGGHGNYIRLQHSGGLATAYAHMSRFAVKSGQQVSQGQVIGHVGSTGVSTGPHLHYEVWLKGKPVNPMTLKFIGGTQLSGRDLNNFQGELSRLRSLAVTGADTPEPVRPGRRPA